MTVWCDDGLANQRARNKVGGRIYCLLGGTVNSPWRMRSARPSA